MNVAPFKQSWEQNRQPANVTVMMQTARKMEMYFHSIDSAESVPAGEGVACSVSSSSSSLCSLLWRSW